MTEQPRLARRLGVGDAVVIGLGSMIGAGVFASFAPAAAAAGSGLLIGLGLAAVVAYCNASSSAALAARYPESGGTYVYGRERLGEFWGYLAGWGFVVGKTASCAAMALTVAAYATPGADRWVQAAVAVAVVAGVTAVNYAGVQKSAGVTRVLVGVTLVVLAVVVAAAWSSDGASLQRLEPFPGASFGGVLEAAGLLFFAFAGYARIATLGEEVRDPSSTIPKAIPTALGVTLVVYAAVAVAALAALGPSRLASVVDPLAVAAGADLAPVVRVGAAVAAVGALLALLLGVSRTTFAMARDGHLPRTLAAVHPRFGGPYHAELAVGVAVAVLAASVDLRGAIGFSAFAVLGYYAIANTCALTLPRGEGRPPLVVPVLGLVGCVVLAASLPTVSVLSGVGVLALGAGVYAMRRIGRG